jgi:hypothetical protein
MVFPWWQHLADYRILKLASVDLPSVRLAGPPVDKPDPIPAISDSVLERCHPLHAPSF